MQMTDGQNLAKYNVLVVGGDAAGLGDKFWKIQRLDSPKREVIWPSGETTTATDSIIAPRRLSR